jgi:hypothetical protein
VFGDADAVGARCVDDQDAVRAGGGDVDVVDTGSRARDDAQLWRRVEKRGVDFGRTANEQRVGVGKIGGERRGWAAGSRVDDPAGFGAQQVERRRRQVVRDDDFQWDLTGPRERT